MDTRLDGSPAIGQHMGFELTLAGPGRVWLRHVELTRTS